MSDTLEEARPELAKAIGDMLINLVKDIVGPKIEISKVSVDLQKKFAEDLSIAIHDYVTSAKVTTKTNGNNSVFPTPKSAFIQDGFLTSNKSFITNIDDHTGFLE